MSRPLAQRSTIHGDSRPFSTLFRFGFPFLAIFGFMALWPGHNIAFATAVLCFALASESGRAPWPQRFPARRNHDMRRPA